MLRRAGCLLRHYKSLTLETVNPKVIKAEYAVRGDVVLRAMEMDKQLAQGTLFPFKEIIPCNIGNPQVLGQKPLSWIRQNLSIVSNPDLLSAPQIHEIYPSDVIERSKHLLKSIPGGTGAYSASQGIPVVRESVAKYIEDRDGVGPSDPNSIFLTNGASVAVDFLFWTMLHSEKDGVMIPIPQYPLYDAMITLHNASAVGYYLDSRENHWVMNLEEMQQKLDQARAKGIRVGSLVVINPGNPTGQVLSLDDMVKVVKFCEQNKILLIADEVYQENVYAEGKVFHSFRKVVKEMNSDLELISMHSLSKGFLGECGLRGGYMELYNIDRKVQEQILKVASINLCSNSIGQVATELSVNPPKPGEPSYELYQQEKSQILDSLKRKASSIHQALNDMENITCNYVEGAMYAFAEVKFSEKAQQKAQEEGMQVDKFYVMKALEETGVVLVPGSGFGQKPGRFHFRITALPSEEKLSSLLKDFKHFNQRFHQKYS